MTTSTVPATLSDLSGNYVPRPGPHPPRLLARHAMVTKVRGEFNEFGAPPTSTPRTRRVERRT